MEKHTRITERALDRIEQRADAATPVPRLVAEVRTCWTIMERQATELRELRARLERLEAALRDVHEPCWTAVSELESLVLTQSDLPDVYRMNVQRAFAALRKANAVLEVPDARTRRA